MIRETSQTASPGSVSVAMCTFNGARFLSQQLDSIAQQTSLPDELVVCDDGSDDDTVALLTDFAERAPFPVHVHRNAERLRFFRQLRQVHRALQR